ncbi:uncharacterized protein LOC117299272 isoform X2 [Asterias rubens]|uniref:uncharacterized protein LOC117299272 isoform X2 n=1 Tax=Asterias rubens TaxID=7604 RepID=UPI0014559990|nr:uncharacterized protein LOC117299272 isoform X2 [Asterias rubens]
MKVVMDGDTPVLCLLSIKPILRGSEILYHYGVDKLPWKNKKDLQASVEQLQDGLSQEVEELPTAVDDNFMLSNDAGRSETQDNCLVGSHADSLIKDLQTSVEELQDGLSQEVDELPTAVDDNMLSNDAGRSETQDNCLVGSHADSFVKIDSKRDNLATASSYIK